MSPAPDQKSESALYRRVWRWHFYAGLVCLPFLALMAATGALYLFKDPLESLVYAKLRLADAPRGAPLDGEALVARALASRPGQAVRFNAPATAERSAEVGIRTTDGVVGVYLDPTTGRILGELADDQRLMEVVKGLHSLAIAGKWANYWVEIVAGWAIVLVVSGIFLWWPRGRTGGIYSVRGRPRQRTWWRDVHAVTGVTASVAIIFLATTGMPWSAFWGQQFGQLTSAWGIGLPKYLFGPGPPSSPPLTAPGTTVPWVISQAPVPSSAPLHGAHGDHHHRAAPVHAGPDDAPAIGLNRAVQIFAGLGVQAGTPISLPSGPNGVYTAMQFPPDVRQQRVVHLDRYTGAVLADVGYQNYGTAGRLIEWGINIHTGLQFGWINQLVMLAACLSVIALAVSAVAMWWKRRPSGRLAAPSRQAGDRAAMGAVSVAAALGLFYPLLGASMIAALIVDALIPRSWHARFGL